MKATTQTVQSIGEKMRVILSSRFPAVFEAIKADPASVTTAELWTIWYAVFDEVKNDDTHPRFRNRSRVLPFDPTFAAYPDDTNDATLETALRAALRVCVSA